MASCYDVAAIYREVGLEKHSDKTYTNEVEYLKTTREEILFRIKHRDSYLKMYMIIQTVLIAMSKGIAVAGTKVNHAHPEALLFSAPIALIFCLLYSTEDRLIGHLSKYIGKAAKSIPTMIPHWECSDELRAYSNTTLYLRVLAQWFAFFFVPLLFSIEFFWSQKGETLFPRLVFMYAIEIICLIMITGVLVFSFSFRKTTGKH